MGRTTFTGPLMAGTIRDNQYRNVGSAVLSQTVTVNQAGAGTQNITLYVPANSRLLGFTVDLLTVWDSATSAALTVGTASAGTQYVSSLDVKTGPAGRMTIAPTAAQLTAMASTAVDAAASAAAGAPVSPLVITLAAVGATSAGQAVVTVQYVQANPQGAGV